MYTSYLSKSDNPKVDELAQQIVKLLVPSGLSYQEIGDVLYEVRTRISIGTCPTFAAGGAPHAAASVSTPPAD